MQTMIRPNIFIKGNPDAELIKVTINSTEVQPNRGSEYVLSNVIDRGAPLDSNDIHNDLEGFYS